MFLAVILICYGISGKVCGTITKHYDRKDHCEEFLKVIKKSEFVVWEAKCIDINLSKDPA